MAQLQAILDRLVAENLHGPVTTTTDNTSAVSSAMNYQLRSPRKPTSHSDLFNGHRKEEEVDLDSNDPRWANLFFEYFLESSNNKDDDLLFFVRQTHPGDEDLDPVFVKRKLPESRVLPPLEDPILWKETFFLNLIVQLPCKLTVAVCTRTTSDIDGKTSMTCSKKHVSKRVYALPKKSRMDIKESSMECSYPVIYYVIDDYEEVFEHLTVSEGEHLCVELAATIPRKSDMEDESDDGENESDDEDYSHDQSNEKPMTNGPFPQPCSDNKITLFQGAVPYYSLLEIYKQKAASKPNRRFKIGPVTPPTEYVMMRGPSGKGHAQVAITALTNEEEDFKPLDSPEKLPSSFSAESFFENQGSRTWNNNSNYSNAEKVNPGSVRSNSQSSEQQRQNSSGSFFQSLKRLSQLSINDRASSEPESLKCCMTFVNIHWTGVVSDLTSYARKKNST